MRVVRLSCLAAVALTIAAAPVERDWSAALRADAQAMHDDIAADHPGPVNRADPGFSRRNDAQLKIALARARDATSYEDYYYALQAYAASFDDGHVSVSAVRTVGALRWPGFLTSYDANGTIRVFVSETAAVPVGARLLECDGRSGEVLATDRLGRMWGRWRLEAQREDLGRLLFVDTQNKYIHQPDRCTFLTDAGKREVTLDWRPISFPALGVKSGAIALSQRPPFAVRVLHDGTRWFSLPSFSGEPTSDAGVHLRSIVSAMGRDQAALADAPAIVLDLRGNGGGSSDWSRQIADTLWGGASTAGLRDSGAYAEFRVSAANLATFEADPSLHDAEAPPMLRNELQRRVDGMRQALARNQTLWRDEGQAAPAGPPSGSATSSLRPLRGQVFVVTDSRCASACLDAVDLWRALGAVHVGRTTTADTLYMEAPRRMLPGGMVSVSIPMKVFRGRPRGSNEPLVPTHVFGGDIADDTALERWIATLPERHRASGGVTAAPHTP